MRKYSSWFLRSNAATTRIEDTNMLAAIRHMIKCTSVRRHACGNADKWVMVRESGADIIGRPLFTVSTPDSVIGVAFPTTKEDDDDLSTVELFIDCLEHPNIHTHASTALRHETERLASAKSPTHVAKTDTSKGRRKRPKDTQANGQTNGSSAGGTMVISVIGSYIHMQGLVQSINHAIRGHPVQMSVLNSV